MIKTDSVFDKTIKDVADYTGFKESYLRDVIKALKDVLEPYFERGDNNEYLFSSNAFPIFYQVKVLRENGLRLGKIKTHIEKELRPLINSISVETENNTINLKNTTKNETVNPLLQNALNQLQEKDTRLYSLNMELLKAKDEFFNIKVENENLKSTMKLLTDGRPPEEVRAEQMQKEREILENKHKLEIALKDKDQAFSDLKKKEEELKSIDFENQNRVLEKEKEILEQKNRLTRLEDEKKQLQKTKEEEFQRLEREKNQKLQEQEKILREKEEKAKVLEKEKQELEEKAKEKENKRQEIIKELDALEGKWFVGTKRKELLKQLQDLV